MNNIFMFYLFLHNKKHFHIFKSAMVEIKKKITSVIDLFIVFFILIIFASSLHSIIILVLNCTMSIQMSSCTSRNYMLSVLMMETAMWKQGMGDDHFGYISQVCCCLTCTNTHTHKYTDGEAATQENKMQKQTHTQIYTLQHTRTHRVNTYLKVSDTACNILWHSSCVCVCACVCTNEPSSELCTVRCSLVMVIKSNRQ